MYKIHKHGGCIRLSDGAYIPAVPGNNDWDEYQKWLVSGGSPLPVETLEEAKTRRISEITAEAGSRILARLPDYRQRNMLARLHELHDKRLDGAALTTAEQAEVTNFRAAWNRVKQVRQVSNAAEAQVSAATTIEAVNAVTPNWPA